MSSSSIPIEPEKPRRRSLPPPPGSVETVQRVLNDQAIQFHFASHIALTFLRPFYLDEHMFVLKFEYGRMGKRRDAIVRVMTCIRSGPVYQRIDTDRSPKKAWYAHLMAVAEKMNQEEVVRDQRLQNPDGTLESACRLISDRYRELITFGVGMRVMEAALGGVDYQHLLCLDIT